MGLLDRAIRGYGAATAPQPQAQPGQPQAPPDQYYDTLLKVLAATGGGAIGSGAGLLEQLLRKRRQPVTTAQPAPGPAQGPHPLLP